ncbi:glucose-6-phosphate isomerase, cytosolic 2 [Momordica charantia]|uniref:Glucose-6-phosphate isomerase, cytosolic 2 n=1 Tax=Momordica charantia TaxID=3673 RepID=A0A6J1CSE9_MOMCH|nr:glucose-6-phosphate isomerase, cytosolic 2 [Momordica charantia]XP_022144130.1 glucose-6-phosphate isomerase, cytosolic 2 [Momordica charantia]XP_022144131.1 glucose-6-phosphate isomerase, cytosolic 2 [Momordica charantia]XP_022144132.1 glucose-6-phosphate isomerase, cytosolic 2 [Momordica charantia]XP_022144133.1 glucose-6-phosphate isomerase, cytosolic 2 [Momordica charantia]XP_022144135.1 glucose-6-phosphate isomerase, cytosolic 2 [Momordica charantia]XP_022144136.1 glucose-6-phosphate 
MASSALISDSEAWKNLKAHLRDLMSDAARCKSMMVWSSLSILLPSLNAYNIGQPLATQVRKQLNASRTKGGSIEGFNFSTTLLKRYLEASSDVPSDLPALLPRTEPASGQEF